MRRFVIGLLFIFSGLSAGASAGAREITPVEMAYFFEQQALTAWNKLTDQEKAAFRNSHDGDSQKPTTESGWAKLFHKADKAQAHPRDVAKLWDDASPEAKQAFEHEYVNQQALTAWNKLTDQEKADFKQNYSPDCCKDLTDQEWAKRYYDY